jgi:hypothetical protein
MNLEGNKYLEMLKYTEEVEGPLYEFTKSALMEYGNEELLADAEKVCDVLWKMLDNKGIYTPGQRQTVIDVLLAAGLLHNLFFNYKDYVSGASNDWEQLFIARKLMHQPGLDAGLSEEILNATFSAIESQLGAQTPLKSLKPSFGTPTENFATAMWIVYELMA